VTDRFREFALPDLGEGLTEGEILQWLVSPGDTVHLNQPVVEVETAKAAVEIPSPYAGVVAELLVEAGNTVDVGSVIIRFDTDPVGDVEDSVEEVGARPTDELVPPAATRPPAREAVLVGYGVRQGTAVRRPRRAPSAVAPTVTPTVTPTVAPTGAPTPAPARVSAAEVAAAAASQLSPGAGEAVPPATVVPLPARVARVHVLAKPPVRKLARDQGVDLAKVQPSGPGGTVTREDVIAAATTAEPDFSALRPPAGGRAGRRVPVRGVRRATAEAMVASAFTAPHVTLFATVDVTPAVELVDRLRQLPEFAGGSVGPMLLVARALVLACRRHPEVNAAWDEAAKEIEIHGGVHLGVAAATDRGLIVPVVPDADLLSLPALSHALAELTATARAGRATPAQLTGGTITLTNVGSFGVDNGTPILVPGQAAILCLGAVREQPWVHEGQLAIRRVTQLALSFDHRLVDGALGASVLRDVAAVLADPTHLLAWG